MNAIQRISGLYIRIRFLSDVVKNIIEDVWIKLDLVNVFVNALSGIMLHWLGWLGYLKGYMFVAFYFY